MDPSFFAAAVLILLFSVILHEVMHGWVALKFGDRTAEQAGRLTLNPIPHIDLFGTILLPTLLFLSTGGRMLFGWAKPVPVNPLNFRDIRKGELAVSSAGILTNIALAILALILFRILAASGNLNLLSANILRFTLDINLILATFNLLPIPPLDGSKIIMSYLPARLEMQYRSLERYGIFILLLLWFIPIGGTTLLGAILGTVLGFFHSILGV